jgi:hypothetical protein
MEDRTRRDEQFDRSPISFYLGNMAPRDHMRTIPSINITNWTADFLKSIDCVKEGRIGVFVFVEGAGKGTLTVFLGGIELAKCGELVKPPDACAIYALENSGTVILRLCVWVLFQASSVLEP